MKKVFKIGVKYCGGCNPHIDRGLLVEKVRERLDEQPVVFTGFQEEDLDLLFLVSGCGTGCVEEFRKEENPNRLGVSGRLFRFRRFDNLEDLAGILAREIKTELAQEEK